MQLEDLNTGPPLLPPGDAKLRAHCRLWSDFVGSVQHNAAEGHVLTNAGQPPHRAQFLPCSAGTG
jgi:glutathione S-transferase